MNLRFAGFGGQGVVMCGYIFGKAAMRDGKNAIHTQSYGSASRGGLTSSDVGIETDQIYELCVEELDALVAMSQQSYDAYREKVKEGGLLIYESDLVTLHEHEPARAFGIAATDLAYKSFGRKIIANMVMIGCVSAVTAAVSEEALTRTIREIVPRGTEKLNLDAFREGQRMARELGG